MAKQPNDYKKQANTEDEKFLKARYAEFQLICSNYKNFFDFLEREYDCDPDYWVRKARKAGFEIIKKGNKFYMLIETDGTK